MRFFALLVAFFCLLPVLLVAASWIVALPAQSQENWLHVQQVLLAGYASTSFLLAAGVLLLTLPLGIGAAWYVTQYQFKGRKVMQFLLAMPLALPGYISAFAYGSLLDYAGPVQTMLRHATGWEKADYWFPAIRSTGGAVWVLGFTMLPYIYLIARTGFASQPPAWREVAQSMGISRLRFFWKIALPACRPFVAAGAALVLMEAFADIGTVGVLGVPTLASGVYRSWAFMHEPLVAARLAGLLLMAIILVLFTERLSRRRRISFNTHNENSRRQRMGLTRNNAALAYVCCGLPIIAGFLIPLLYILKLFFFSFSVSGSQALVDNMRDSVIACAASGFIICTLALFLVMAERKRKSPLRAATMFATLGYAVPGVVIAVGLLVLMGWLREATSILLIGTLVGLFAGFIIRYMAVGYNPIHGASTRISPEMDMAASSLGSSGWSCFRRVHLPLLRPALYTAFLLVALDVLKELPITLILRPFGFKTLAISAYDFASDDRASEAAPFALALILFATLAIILLQLSERQEKHHGQH